MFEEGKRGRGKREEGLIHIIVCANSRAPNRLL